MRKKFQTYLSTLYILVGTAQFAQAQADFKCSDSILFNGAYGQVCEEPSKGKVTWIPECTKDETIGRLKKCNGKQYSATDTMGRLLKTISMTAQRDLRPTTSSYCPGAVTAYPDDHWVSYTCRPEPAIYNSGRVNYDFPRVSILYSTRPLYFLDKKQNQMVINDAKPVLMSGSIEMPVSDTAHVQLCQNYKAMKASNAFPSADFKQITLYFDGSKKWNCFIETGANNSGISVLQRFQDQYLQNQR